MPADNPCPVASPTASNFAPTVNVAAVILRVGLAMGHSSAGANEGTARKAWIQVQVGTDELVDARSGNLPLAHESADDSAARDDVAPPRPGNRHRELTDRERCGISKLRRLRFDLLIEF